MKRHRLMTDAPPPPAPRTWGFSLVKFTSSFSCHLHYSPIRHAQPHRSLFPRAVEVRTFTCIFMLIGSLVFCPEAWALSVQVPCVLGSPFCPWSMRKTLTFWEGRAGIHNQFSLLQVICLYKVLWDPLWKDNIDKRNIKHYLLSSSV